LPLPEPRRLDLHHVIQELQVTLLDIRIQLARIEPGGEAEMRVLGYPGPAIGGRGNGLSTFGVFGIPNPVP
jgi:hypothetical protein